MSLIAAEVVGAAYLIVDAAGAFPLAAGSAPPGFWLALFGVLGLVATPFVSPVVGATVRTVPAFGWLLAPACAGFFAAFTWSYDHGADGYVPRYANEHPGLEAWAVVIGAASLVIAALTLRWPRIGLPLTAILAVACLLPMIAIALAGH